MTGLPKRKPTRMKGYDYNTPGMYFLTVCIRDREHLLGQIVGCGDFDAPYNSEPSKFISLLKRYCNREYGRNIWQRNYHDHIIRGQKDYEKIWEYIDTNVVKWESNCFYNV